MQAVSEFEYSQGDLLGHGAFALVFKGRHRQSHQPVAIKQIALKSVPGKLSNIRQKEITILKDLKDVNIVQLFDFVETATDIYLVMEYCNGGDLGDYLIAKKTLSENSIRHLACHIAGALRVLQQFHIIHRDIKPQNLLLSYSSTPTNSTTKKERTFQEATIKLADFGFARYLQGTDMAATLCGSPLYMAPEILLGRRYDSKADLWSVGTILFQCLSGTAPFLASNPHALRKRYEKENLAPKIPAGTSHYLTDLLLKLLKKQPPERMNYDEFFTHDFLKDPSSLPSEVVFGSGPPPLSQQHSKSSPVPIKRHNAKGLSPHSSPRLSASPHHGSSSDFYNVSPSSASGPPSSHRVGSHGSLPYYSAHSSSSDVTDQGFILVDIPGGSGASSRRCSLPVNSPPSDHHSSPLVDVPGSLGHGNSHTPSSSGSLTRYSSLTTPFYKVPLQRQQIAAVHYGFVPFGSATPTNTNLDSPHGFITYMPAVGSNPQSTGFHSNSYARRRSENSLPVFARSPPLPFGRLVYHQHPPFPQAPSNSSPSSSPHTQSGSPLNQLYRNRSASLSPHSTPPSANLPSPVGVASSGRTIGHGMRYGFAQHGSGTKLSSLAEERVKVSSNARGAGNKAVVTKAPNAKGKSLPIRDEKPSSLTGDFITQSCLLNSDDEFDGGGDIEEEEENFPLSLSMNSSIDSTSELSQQISSGIHHESLPHSRGERVSFTAGGDAVKFKVRSPEFMMRPASAKERESKVSMGGDRRLQRASSFSQQRNRQLSLELADIRQRALSLSVHGDPLDPNFTAASLMTGGRNRDLELSPSSDIVTFKLPFVFTSSSGSQDPASPSFTSSGGGEGGSKLLSSSPLSRGSLEVGRTEGVEEGEEFSSGSLAVLRQSYLLGRELLKMAKARQGPIMLLSTQLSDSGVANRLHRCTEQLVLVAKAIAVLESGLRQYRIEQATADVSSLEENTSLHMKRVELEMQRLLDVCMDEARQVREQQRHYVNSRYTQLASSVVSAERLLCLEALDMCKSAVLNEQCGENKECVKRYRRAKLIFQFLLSEAHTLNDKTVLNKYVLSIDHRIQHLLASL